MNYCCCLHPCGVQCCSVRPYRRQAHSKESPDGKPGETIHQVYTLLPVIGASTVAVVAVALFASVRDAFPHQHWCPVNREITMLYIALGYHIHLLIHNCFLGFQLHALVLLKSDFNFCTGWFDNHPCPCLLRTVTAHVKLLKFGTARCW